MGNTTKSPVKITPVDTAITVVKNHHIMGGAMTIAASPTKEEQVHKFGLFFLGQDDDAPEHRSQLYGVISMDDCTTGEGLEHLGTGNTGLMNMYPMAPSKQRLVEQMEDAVKHIDQVTFEFFRFDTNANMTTWMQDK